MRKKVVDGSYEIFKNDFKYMEKAIICASRSKSRDKTDPKVGAVIVGQNGKELGCACRGELHEGDHAEFTLLQKKIFKVKIF
ncbi:MAG TPA: hypothetical protein VMY59_00900 [Candidatus Thermoplasmatota archaeon]|nr:hypothetical protein [Candidatus Thermoplasmatota archaeon]